MKQSLKRNILQSRPFCTAALFLFIRHGAMFTFSTKNTFLDDLSSKNYDWYVLHTKWYEL